MFLIPVCIFLATGRSSLAQDQQQPNQNASPPATVHGIVRVGASGEPLSHALVRISGDAAAAVLTDGNGRFEIAEVPEGPQDFVVMKPGYLDETEARADSMAWNAHGYGHNVIVASGMGNVVFTMEPVNSIRGQVQLSTGDIAEDIQVTLLKRTVQDGRVVWQTVTNAKTNSEGVYRFGELSDGQYVVYTQPTMDSETENNLVERGRGNDVVREGYASVFYPDARDLAAAAKIHVAGGEQAQANISLTLERFQPVTASVTMPNLGSGASNVSIQVQDARGNPLPYAAQYDGGTHTAQAFLPDGNYTLLATATSTLMHIMAVRNGGGGLAALTAGCPGCSPVMGEVTVSVAGRAVPNLHLSMSPEGTNPVQVTVERGLGDSAPRGDERVTVTLSQTGGALSDGMVSSYAEGTISRSLDTAPPPPGSYWVHTSIASKSLCEGSFTAGGANLAREPLVLGLSGTTATLVLALRNDCASLTLLLPNSVGLSAGEERSYTVYAVPDFDSTEDVVPQTLRPSTGGRITLRGLTPGNYHVYAFARPVALEYRNPSVLASLPGQAVALAPNAEAELTLEAPQP
jgi:hypothetical protein